MTDFDDQLRAIAADMEAGLNGLLGVEHLAGPGKAPERLVAAMRHGTLNGGKRLRPLLLRQSAAVFGVPTAQTIAAGLAVELIHCYSLIHDDLPAMDDDDLRRGKPTVHRLFDEATAILAGDSLIAHAFGLLAGPQAHADEKVRIALVAELASGSGAAGMAGGQMRDLESENARITDNQVALMQQMKTGALMRAAVRMGALIGGANAEAMTALTTYGEAAGLAFQIADDILDKTATAEQMGKRTAKDARRGKQTLVARLGLEAAQVHLGDTVHKAISALTPFGEEADGLRQTARYFAERER